jgi:hypothetical protein
MAYARPSGAPRNDFLNARAFELQVGAWLGDYKVGNLEASDRLDWWVPGVFIDVKEKRQPLGKQWHLLPGVPELDLFVIDELSVRRAAQHFPHAYFVIRDVPGGERIFLARIDEMFSVERVRVNRVGNTGHAKGKWIVSLSNFRQLTDPATQLLPTVLHDQQSMPWKYSHCVTQQKVREI